MMRSLVMIEHDNQNLHSGAKHLIGAALGLAAFFVVAIA